ncbi:MAG TPA: tetratricopeptide repeat protein [Vicinamibacterales bacterium]|nr:tetratricopeptide repeat protein [Vicinamibacterales bacterium]
MNALPPNARSRALAALIPFLAVFVIKLAVFLDIGRHPLLVPVGQQDDAFYTGLADRVAHGDVWLADPASFAGRPAPPFFLSPLYIYVLAALLKVSGGSVAFVRLVQIALGTAGVWLLAITARRWYGERAAWWTAALACLFGLATFYELLIVPASLDPFLTALDLFLITRAIDRDSATGWALAGAALGLHALNRPNVVLVFGAFAVLVLFWTFRPRDDRPRSTVAALAAAAAFVLAGLIAIAPATLRNWRVAHEFVLISSPAGLDVLIGNGPEATGTLVAAMNVEPTVPGRWIEAPAAASRGLLHDASANDTSRYFLQQSLAWMAAHPWQEIRLLARKTRYTLSATFISISHSYPFFVRDNFNSLTLLLAGPTLIVPFGLVGLVVARPADRRGYWLWAVYAPLSLLSVVVFYVAARYRLPMQIALLAPAAAAIAWMFDRSRARAWGQLAPVAGVTAALALFVAWPTGLDDGRAEAQVKLALFDIRTGRDAEGEAAVTRALAKHGDPDGVHLRVGQLYETLNRPADAVIHYRAGLTHDPDSVPLHFALGRALFALGKDEDAVGELVRARSGPLADAATRILVLSLSRLHRADEANQLVRTLDPSRWTGDQAREFAAGLASVGRLDLSLAAWRRAAEATGDPQDYERLGLTWAMVGRPAEAVAPLEEAARRAPTSASIRLNYAVALYSVGRKDDARREAEHVLEIDPKYDKARQFLDAIKGK